MEKVVHIIGGGLAGSEAAYQLAEKGFEVHLYEMRRGKKASSTPAHKTDKFAELVCSNSFGSQTDYSAPGQLKWEAEQMNSLILKCAQRAYVPAGMALGVDREKFSEYVTTEIKEHKNIMLHEEIITDWKDLDGFKIIATGPLTHKDLANNLMKHLDQDSLYFFDAIAPIVDTESINMDICWKADRYGRGTNDYINCPMTQEEYYHFIKELTNAKTSEFKDFEKEEIENTTYFEGCMPIEVMASRGVETLRFGPLSAKGLSQNPHKDDSRKENRPYAVLQLRQDNKEGTAYNLVGCQTKMTYSEQKRVFSLVPGLENAEYLKLGSIHRNMFINSPKVLDSTLCSKTDPTLFFAGQITGVEGYFESTCTALMVAHFINQRANDLPSNPPPRETALGSLLSFLNEERERYQPMNINFSLLPPMDVKRLPKQKKTDFKRYRKDQMLLRAKNELISWIQTTHK